MYASSRTRHDVYLSCMSLCIIMFKKFIRSLCFSVRSLFRDVSHDWMFLISVALIGKNKL